MKYRSKLELSTVFGKFKIYDLIAILSRIAIKLQETVQLQYVLQSSETALKYSELISVPQYIAIILSTALRRCTPNGQWKGTEGSQWFWHNQTELKIFERVLRILSNINGQAINFRISVQTGLIWGLMWIMTIHMMIRWIISSMMRFLRNVFLKKRIIDDQSWTMIIMGHGPSVRSSFRQND